jgi:hypothetical protein
VFGVLAMVLAVAIQSIVIHNKRVHLDPGARQARACAHDESNLQRLFE